jgi:hypothetical protein
MLGLRALINYKNTSTTILLVEDYIGMFTTYLKCVQLLSTELSSIVVELYAVKP